MQIILHDTLPAYCIPKVVRMETEENICDKVYASPRPPPKISLKHDWMKELDSEVAGSSKDTQRIQPKPKTQLSRTKQNASRWTRWRKKISPITRRPEEFERDKKTWSISLNPCGRNAPMKLRSDFSEALTKMHRLHRGSGEERLAPIPFYQHQKWHSSSSSSSTSWWQWNDHWWSS